jgi:DNA-binding transcriptional LysR family regulator
MSANDPRTVWQLVSGGAAGIGCLLRHLCRSDIEAGRLVSILPKVPVPAAEINVAFPSKRYLPLRLGHLLSC